MVSGFRASRGQSTVEWIGLVLLVCLVVTGLLAAGVRVPGVALAHSLSTKLLCAASLSGGCAGTGSLESAYGDEIAADVRAHAPTLMYGRDMLGLPVDYRTCRSPYCADLPGDGEVAESTAGEAVTLFTRVIDCRGGDLEAEESAGSESTGPESAGPEESTDPVACGRNEGLYIHYWAYYPESASLRGAPVLEAQGHHPNDWESTQIRIDGAGSVSQRSSSHAGYNHGRSATNWGADLGWGFLTDAAELAGLRSQGGWGEASGRYLIAGGSHAGNVVDDTSPENYPSYTPAGLIRLVPLETVKDGPLSRPARFDPITPPWRKEVWTNPEAEGTG